MEETIENVHLTTKSCILHYLHNYIIQIEQGENLKDGYSAGFYFKFLIQLKKFQRKVEYSWFPSLEEDFYYKCLFYETKFVIHICKKGCSVNPLEIVIIETPLLSVNEYAKLYNVTEGAVRQWIRRGLITNAIKSGNEWRIPEFCDVKAPKSDNHEYFWDKNLTEIPELDDYFKAYDSLSIKKGQENDQYILFFHSRFKEHHDDLETYVDTNTKEKIELWLIANPLVYSPGELIDMIV